MRFSELIRLLERNGFLLLKGEGFDSLLRKGRA